LLLKQPTTALFVSQNGGIKGPSALSKQFRKFIKREMGLDVHAHLMRHLMAYFYLKENPGSYVTVQRILSHNSLQTTLDSYTGFETETDHEQFDDMIAKLSDAL
jgi:site-specific recombinase XerC